jgi:hypothetical protein
MAVARIDHPELFFGLVAPVGVDLDMIIEVLTTELILQKYNISTIHVTEIMRDVPSNITLQDEPYLERINTRIAYADEICSRIEREVGRTEIRRSVPPSRRCNFPRKRRSSDVGLQRSAKIWWR